MNDHAPKAIIIDQDWAMKGAIAPIFPNTCYKYCLWHIMQKLLKKVNAHSQFYHELKTSI